MKLEKKETNYTVIIVSGATSTNKEFVISSNLIRNSLIAFSVLFLLSGFFIFKFLTISFDTEKMKRLEMENKEKESTIVKLRDTEAMLKQMAVFKDRILVAMGLTSPEALELVGSGGGIEGESGNVSITDTNVPGNVEIPGSEVILKGTEIKPGSENILKKAETLRTEAQTILQKLKFVESAMEQQKVRLASTPSVWPTKGYLTSPFGWRTHPLTGKSDYHNAQDIATQFGNKVIATADGVVLAAEHYDYYGNLIIIDHGFGFTTRYGHLASFQIKEGDHVKRYQVIGYVGNTGRSSAPHLHYEVRYNGKALNPMNFIID